MATGVWKSSDGGLSWRNLSVGFRSGDLTVGSLLVDPQQPQIVYAVSNDGIYRSDDAAAQWSLISNAPFSFVVIDDLF